MHFYSIDLQIKLAEKECELERWKTKVLEQQYRETESLYDLVTDTFFDRVVTENVSVGNLHHWEIREGGIGVSRQQSSQNLLKADRLLEIDGILVKNVEKVQWDDIKGSLLHCETEHNIVFIRTQTINKTSAKNIEADIKFIQETLEQKLKEGKKTSNMLHILEKEQEKLSK